MGTGWSLPEQEPVPDLWWGPLTSGTQSNVPQESKHSQSAAEENNRVKVRKDEMDAFKKDLAQKREARQKAIATLQSEMERLRNEVKQERELRLKAEQERDQLIENRTSLCPESVETEEIKRLVEVLEQEQQKRQAAEEERDKLKEKESELEALEKQIHALKEVASIGREMLRIRELQVNELKTKLQEVEFIQQAAPEDLREEYETQIENIHKLRMLYEERALATRVQHQRELDKEKAKTHVLEVKLSDLQDDFNELQEKKQKYEDKIKELEEALEENKNEIIDLQDKLDSYRAECKGLTSQMQLINNLFSKALVGPEMDLDRLTRLLQDNHGLITDLTAKGDINDIGALLLDIASQAEGENKNKIISESSDLQSSNKPSAETLATQQEIASNLSQVWRVLVELLSHHKNKNPNNVGGSESCYKSVDTPSGPRLVISVSKTFITLKDLILEKKSLVKEVGRLKTLNGHLENRLDVQERRLSVVSTELKKTWGLVSKLRQQHKQLHTQEKILRYELQHKRYMLTELKQELEHCREKWEKAREKNTQTEEDWKQLRKEFALRKARKESNSAESGYEEDDSAQSPPSEINESIHNNNENEPDDDVEHSDGNSYDTVIDLLDISCLENEDADKIYLDTAAQENVQSLPLNDDELCEGLSQIESAELAAELGLTASRTEYSSSFPSSSISSPIPTETDETVSSSEPDISEDDSASNVVSAQYPIHYTSSPVTVHQIPQDRLLFGSNSAQNIARFLDGLNIHYESHIPESSTNSNTSEQTSQKFNLSQENCDLICDNASLNKDKIPSITLSPTIQENYAVQLCLHFEEEHVDDTTSSCLQNYVSVNNVQEDNPVITEKKISCGVCLVDNTATTTSYSQTSPTLQPITESEETQEDIIARLKTLAKTNAPKDKKTTDLPNTGDDTNAVPEKITNHNTPVEPKTESTPLKVEPPRKRTQEQILEARAARLKRMEEQCKSLFSKMSATSHRSDMIASKLDELHEQYGPKEDSPDTQATNSMATVVPTLCENGSTSKSDNQLVISEQSVNKSENQFETLEKHSNTDSTESISTEQTKIMHTLSSSATVSETNSQQCDPDCNIVSQRQESRSPQEVLDARASRLKRLEDQCKSLFSKMSATSQRSNTISNHLDKLHNQYGPSDSPPDSTQEMLHETLPAEVTDKQVIPSDNICDIPSQSCMDAIHPELSSKGSNLNNDMSTENPTEVRTHRLQNLEEQCKTLFRKVADTKHKSETLTIRLEGLREMYGNDDESSQPSTSEDATSSVMVENDGLDTSSSSSNQND